MKASTFTASPGPSAPKNFDVGLIWPKHYTYSTNETRCSEAPFLVSLKKCFFCAVFPNSLWCWDHLRVYLEIWQTRNSTTQFWNWGHWGPHYSSHDAEVSMNKHQSYSIEKSDIHFTLDFHYKQDWSKLKIHLKFISVVITHTHTHTR